jgi:hypothetical protein
MINYGRAVQTLQPVIEPVCDALSKGLEDANEIHTAKAFRRALDPWFYLHAVRRTACDLLRKQGLQAELEGSRRSLALSGIEVHYRGIAMKILRPGIAKSGAMQVPIPGRSRPRQAFWRQDAVLEGMETENLLLLWRDDQGELADPMLLVRPLGGDHRRGSLELDWDGPLSRSMAKLRAEDLDNLYPRHDYRKLGDEEIG